MDIERARPRSLYMLNLGSKNRPCAQIVWFKRDLRVEDHRALSSAAQSGAVIPLFIVEDDFWHQADVSARQWAFVEECLHDLRFHLGQQGQPLIVRRGEVCDVFETIRTYFTVTGLWSHEETGNQWTFERDKRVAAWCRSNGIAWHELQQNGTQRRLKSRNGWAKAWDRHMAEPVLAAPKLRPISDLPIGAIPSAGDLNLREDPCPERQIGGREPALERLHTFLHERGEFYRSEMSNPLTGATACSRLSPYLAWGAVSMREVAQCTWSRQRELKEMPRKTSADWRNAIRSFSGRLHWHCHFIQKLEDEPRLEFANLHPAYDDLRPSQPDDERLNSWKKGETGLPFFDACMRSLKETGWLNFRMRAMVTAVASYNLWLDWRKPGEHLARQFTDYEPGIHWPQIQMQSGTTGINTARIYNPVKQGYDQDPEGAFVRRWIPELRGVEDRFLQEPWKAENASDILGKGYPFPIVDYLDAAKEARQKIWAVRKGSAFRTKANSIQNKHGSRKSGIPMRGKKDQKEQQLTLELDDE
ncbi:MAG: FAD-binding domain-containing protein [Pseudomonadota bacterium]